jgi:predicted signal transduction protein with EAL and GGDEF domain
VRPRTSSAAAQEAVPKVQLEAGRQEDPYCHQRGSSVFPHDGTTYEALLADADHRMYRDKAARRGELTVPITVAPEPEFTTDVFSQAPEVQTLEHAVSTADR